MCHGVSICACMRLCTFLDMISIGRAAGRLRGWRPDFESDHQTPSLTTDKDTKEKTWAPQCNGEVKIVSHVHTYKNRLGHKQRETVTESLYLENPHVLRDTCRSILLYHMSRRIIPWLHRCMHMRVQCREASRSVSRCIISGLSNVSQRRCPCHEHGCRGHDGLGRQAWSSMLCCLR